MEPFSLLHWKFQQISPGLHQKCHPLTLTQQIAMPGLILQQNIFQGMFFNKNTFPRTPANKEIKGSCRHMCSNKCEQKLARRVRNTLKIICLIEQELCSFTALFGKYPLAFCFLVSASAHRFSSLASPQGRGCNWEKEEDELNRSTLKMNRSFFRLPKLRQTSYPWDKPFASVREKQLVKRTICNTFQQHFLN